MTSVTVAGVRPYDVVIGHDLSGHALAEIPDRAQRVALFHAPVFTADATALAVRIAATGRQVMRQELPDAEAAKTADVLAACWRDLGAAGFTRTDVIVGLGGGATTDLVGFVAATWLRGVDVIHLPTTLLGMVDAAVGGKTGINTAAGKNLVGAIHPPRAVLCDLDRLTTLPRADLVAGLAEVVKAGFIADPRILELVEADPAAALDPTSPVLAELVIRAVQVKADVVADDLTESVDRELGRQVLNYGHTLAHAIERREQYRWRHGDAVAVGMMFAAALSHAAGRLSGADVARHRDVLTAVGLPIGYDGAAWPELRDAMSLDKKTRGATLRFVILDAIARPAVLTGPDDLLLQTAFQEVS